MLEHERSQFLSEFLMKKIVKKKKQNGFESHHIVDSFRNHASASHRIVV